MTKKKTNIQPKDVGGFYIDSNGDAYQLTSCESEPNATMKCLSDKGGISEKPISEFASFIRLKPERPRKVRSDKGTTRLKKPSQAKSSPEEDLPTPIATSGSVSVDISTFSLVTGQGEKPHILSLEGVAVNCKTLREGSEWLLGNFSIDREYVENSVESDGKKNLLSILNSRK